MSVDKHGLLCKEKPPQLEPPGRWGRGVAPSVQPYVFLFDQRLPTSGISPPRELSMDGENIFVQGLQDAPLLLSPLSLQTDLLVETWGGRFLEGGVGEVMGLPLYPERGLWRCRRTWLEDWLGAGFLHLGIWAGSFFFKGSPPMHCGMLNRIPGLYPLDASSIPPTPVVTIRNVPRYCQMSPVETQWLRGEATSECPRLLSFYLSRLCPESASCSEMIHRHPAHISP